MDVETIAYYDEAVKTSVLRQQPLISYFHKEFRTDKFGATALTGVQAYMGNGIPDLTGSIVFTDLARDEGSPPRSEVGWLIPKQERTIILMILAQL